MTNETGLTTKEKVMMNLEDAARHVSLETGKQTTKTDILMLVYYGQIRLLGRVASSRREKFLVLVEFYIKECEEKEPLYHGIIQDFDYCELNYDSAMEIRDTGCTEISFTKSLVKNFAGFFTAWTITTQSISKKIAIEVIGTGALEVECSQNFHILPVTKILNFKDGISIENLSTTVFELSTEESLKRFPITEFHSVEFYESDIFVSHQDISHYLYKEYYEPASNNSHVTTKRKPSVDKLNSLRAVTMATIMYLEAKSKFIVTNSQALEELYRNKFKIDQYEQFQLEEDIYVTDRNSYFEKREELEALLWATLRTNIEKILKIRVGSHQKWNSYCHNEILKFYLKFQKDVIEFENIVTNEVRNATLLKHIVQAMEVSCS